MTAARKKEFLLIGLSGYMIILELEENKLLNYVMKKEVSLEYFYLMLYLAFIHKHILMQYLYILTFCNKIQILNNMQN